MKTWHKIALAFTLALSLHASAKDSFLIGLKAGANFSTLSGDFGNIQTSIKTGIHIGIMADMPLYKSLTFSTELLYSTKGIGQTEMGYYYVNNNPVFESIDESITMNYFEVPLLLKIKTKSGFHFDAGPYISFLNSVDYYLSLDTSNTLNIVKTTVTEEFASIDYGLIGGLGYQIEGEIGFNLRYEYGLVDVNKNGVSNLYANRTVALSLNYFF